jgi:hypothetical protein
MADEMSRRGWFGIVGDLLTAFGLAPQAKANLPVPKAPASQPSLPTIEHSTYLGGTGLPSHTTTLVYHACDWPRLNPGLPSPDVTFYTYTNQRPQK